MSPPVDPVASDDVLPVRVDVVVIGGGIIGASTALFLAEKGLKVALCEKGRIGAEQSSRNWGWCRKMGRDPSELPLAIESLRLWEGMNERLGAETGFRKSGIVYLCETQREVAGYEEWLEHARQFQLDSRIINNDEIDRMLPGAGQRWPAALYTPSDGRAEPEKAAPAMAEAARRLGVAILTGCAVRGVETKAGRVAGVVTEKGPIACDTVVLAGGAWSRLFCGNMDVSFPQLKVLSYVMSTEPIDGIPDEAVGASNFAFRKRHDGGYTIAQRNASFAPIVPDSFRLFFDFLPSLWGGRRELRLRIGRSFFDEWRIPRRWALDEASPFEQVRVLDPVPDDNILAEGRANLIKAFPAFEKMVIRDRWTGVIDVTPDAVPVISAVDSAPGFFIASGFSGHGFGIGPAAGRLMADLVAGDAPIVDPAPFHYSRLVKSRVKAAA